MAQAVTIVQNGIFSTAPCHHHPVMTMYNTVDRKMIPEHLIQMAHKDTTHVGLGKWLILLCLGSIFVQSALAQTEPMFIGDSWSEFSPNAEAVCADADIDNDNDGLIEMCYLEDLFNMRYQITGTGYSTNNSPATQPDTTGCRADGCNGYELVRDLDFQDGDSYRNGMVNEDWTTGGGWSNMGDFLSILEGNGHSISNLFQNRSDNTDNRLGFIADLNGQIRNLNFLNMRVGRRLNFAESYFVYDNRGEIINCYIGGEITERFNPIRKSLLIYVNNGEISNVDVNLQIRGRGGAALIRNEIDSNGKLSDSSFQLTLGMRDYQGIIKRANGGDTSNTLYIISTNVNHPIIRHNPSGTIENSYWDTEKGANLLPYQTRGDSSIVSNFRGFTTEELRSPMSPNTDIATSNTQPYYLWREENWDFGTSEQYPVVRYAPGSGSDTPACGTSQQPVCETILRYARNAQPQIISPRSDTEITLFKRGESRIRMVVSDDDEDIGNRLTVEWSALDIDGEDLITTSVQVPPSDDTVNMFDLRIRISAAVATSVTQLRLVATDDSGRDNARSEPVLLNVRVDEEDTPPIIAGITVPMTTIDEGSTQSISVQVINMNNDYLTYRWSGDTEALDNTDRDTALLRIPPDFVAAALTSTTLVLRVEVSDSTFSTARMVMLSVRKINNGRATIEDSVEIGSSAVTLTATIISTDPDGGPDENAMYQWQVCTEDEGRCATDDDWKNIAGATAPQYIISGPEIELEGGETFTSKDGSRIFRAGLSYTDGQGYPEKVETEGISLTTIRVNVKVFLEGALR